MINDHEQTKIVKEQTNLVIGHGQTNLVIGHGQTNMVIGHGQTNMVIGQGLWSWSTNMVKHGQVCAKVL